ncbi:GHMP kinase [Candidatus Kuenenbacteria bacterium CG23_combo_of_CG06-09_8_20_14_all_36_9]|uniref:GHMP kinase n=1 Tax=Candidatus Kuenenbacteria bacterium CG10_big_fil_rev_8_21_14_0_10_36_11 TaxID=1974618 RepID=A0A2M6WA03_9BACT|nr:MAG: GHMP kinase [Candidatus Kuenenbacteria bacterium CG23_combo_of_CG06-09_8_20_14_all_36_9]PIT89571.1 MAG: GHMP kinase [Candidatus Kuenenbacteria bacterium CG10_big_fil_rev_8_21_14_0_10_36_11]
MVSKKPICIIMCEAWTRFLDLGGWADTWFAKYGFIFNIAIRPGVLVQIKIYKRNGRKERVCITAESYGQTYLLDPDIPSYKNQDIALLEAALEIMKVPKDLYLEINIYSEMPKGAGTGTSAAVTTALIGALDRLTYGRLAPHEVAERAHKVETEILKLQCGIQDQLCSVFGGINFIEMTDYPRSIVSQIALPKEIFWELERRLLLFYLGNAHSSSEIHQLVIKRLEDSGADNPILQGLRKCACDAKDALYEGQLKKFGKIMIKNNELQRALHPQLISTKADQIFKLAQEFKAYGWDVNGAGGNGGSVTIFCSPDDSTKRKLIDVVEKMGGGIQYIPTNIPRDCLRVWQAKF